MFKKFTILFFILTSNFCFSQEINFSNNLTISVLTCSTGEELYSQFGHSAFRVQDHQNNIDIVYNYGIFDYSKPNFYTNFVKGKLYYMLGYNTYYNFIKQYQYENRSVVSQQLNLSISEKIKLINFLQNNAKPENATYQYTFFYNNCATKIRDVLEEVFPKQIIFKPYLTTNYTQRDLINNNVPHNSWSNVGINIALGSVIDKKATPRDYQFLPEYIAKSFKHATFNGKALVKKKEILFHQQKTVKTFNFTSPYVIFTVLSLLILVITYFDAKHKRRNKTLDFMLHFITGLIGVVVILLWFATYHAETKGNLNILWAFAPNLFIAFVLLKKQPPKWIVLYYNLLLILLSSVFIIWIFKLEAFGYALIPLLISLLIRYLYSRKYFSLRN